MRRRVCLVFGFILAASAVLGGSAGVSAFPNGTHASVVISANDDNKTEIVWFDHRSGQIVDECGSPYRIEFAIELGNVTATTIHINTIYAYYWVTSGQVLTWQLIAYDGRTTQPEIQQFQGGLIKPPFGSRTYTVGYTFHPWDSVIIENHSFHGNTSDPNGAGRECSETDTIQMEVH